MWCRCLQAFETADRANTETDKNFVTTNKALNKAVHFIVSNRAWSVRYFQSGMKRWRSAIGNSRYHVTLKNVLWRKEHWKRSWGCRREAIYASPGLPTGPFFLSHPHGNLWLSHPTKLSISCACPMPSIWRAVVKAFKNFQLGAQMKIGWPCFWLLPQIRVLWPCFRGPRIITLWQWASMCRNYCAASI